MIYRAKVTNITNGQAYVEIPELGIGQEFGPCEMMYNSLSVGDRALCVQIKGAKEDIVIVGNLSAGVSAGSSDVIDGNETNTTIIDGNA